MSKKLAVVVGRFQLPQPHIGHKWLLEEAALAGSHVLVVLGSAQEYATRRNPLPMEYRKLAVTSVLAQVTRNYTVVFLADQRADEQWSKLLDMKINNVMDVFDCTEAVLLTDEHGFASHYSGKFPVRILKNPIHNVRATQLRETIGKNPLGSTDWAKGVVWATQQGYPLVMPTVDIACFGEKGALLVGKKSGESQWRLPGGFVDVTDANYLAAAKRELAEEAGYIETSNWHMLESFSIPDWRVDGQTSKIVSTLFSCLHVFGAPVAGDDLAVVEWVYGKLDPNTIVKEHHEMFDFLKRI